MLKPGECTVKPWPGHKFYKYRVNYHAEGKLQRKGFVKRKDAEEFVSRWLEQVKQGGIEQAVTDTERSAVIELRDSLARAGLSLRDAIQMALERQSEIDASITVANLIELHLARKEKEGRSPDHLKNLRLHLRKFAESFGDRPVATISTEEISRWLEGLGVTSKVTVANYRRSLSAIFRRAQRSGWAGKNAVDGAFNPGTEIPEVGHLTVEEARALLGNCCDQILPAVAIGLFAGLRRREIENLDWENIVLRDGVGGDWGVIRARKTKTKKPRPVEILPVLAAWLKPYAKPAGPIWPLNGRNLFEAARYLAGFGSPAEVQAAAERGETLKLWPNNALRHSYGTYFYAAFESLSKTAKQMGNSEGIIERHYNAAAEKRDGEAFFALFPDGSKPSKPRQHRKADG